MNPPGNEQIKRSPFKAHMNNLTIRLRFDLIANTKKDKKCTNEEITDLLAHINYLTIRLRIVLIAKHFNKQKERPFVWIILY